MDSLIKRHISQGELDALSVPGPASKTEIPKSEPAREAPLSTGNHAWKIASEGQRLLGVHLRGNRTSAVLIDKKTRIEASHSFELGYENLEKCFAALESWCAKQKIKSVSVVMTYSGPKQCFFVARIPQMGGAQLQKVLQLQIKGQGMNEAVQMGHFPIPKASESKGPADLLVGAVAESFQERVLALAKRSRFKVLAWEPETLSFLKGACRQWQRDAAHGSTRFVIVLEWNQCSLILADSLGKLVQAVLPVGVYSFLEHISVTLGEPVASSRWLDSDAFEVSPKDSLEQKGVKARANEALCELYVPLAEQIRVQMVTMCQQNDIPFPSHFMLVGMGAEHFGLKERLINELGLKRVCMEDWVEAESAAAAGAALWDRSGVRVNLLPARGLELLEPLKERWEGLREKLSSLKVGNAVGAPAASRTPKVFSAGIILLLAMVSYPIGKRYLAQKQLSKSEVRWASLVADRALLQGYLEKKKELEEKLDFEKRVTKLRRPYGAMAREALSRLSPEMNLESLTWDSKGIQLLGRANSQSAIENFLQNTNRLVYYKEAVPQEIRAVSNEIHFKILFPLKEDPKPRAAKKF